jgi:hypothetical protein
MDDERVRIVQALADLYVSSAGQVSGEDLCERAGIDADTFEKAFDGIDAAVAAWYRMAADQTMSLASAIPDFDSLPLQERVGAFCFVLLDVLEADAEFVSATFRSHAYAFGTPFQRAIREHLAVVLDARDVPVVNAVVVDTDAVRFLVSESIVQMVGQWIQDGSKDRARSTALIDKVLALTAELLANRLPERIVDLARYLVEAGYWPLDRVPVIGEWFRTDASER